MQAVNPNSYIVKKMKKLLVLDVKKTLLQSLRDQRTSDR